MHKALVLPAVTRGPAGGFIQTPPWSQQAHFHPHINLCTRNRFMDVPGLAAQRSVFKCSDSVNDRLQRTSPVKVTAYAFHPIKTQGYFIT